MCLKSSEMEANPENPGMGAAMLWQARNFVLTGGGFGRIIRHSRIVMQLGDQTHLMEQIEFAFHEGEILGFSPGGRTTKR